jgi:transcriptional regulator with XRE-family HTH domain
VPLDPAQVELLQAIGGNVRRLRQRAKLTQERLAELVGINPRTIQKIEAGKLNILATTLARLQAAWDCRGEELMRVAEPW